jgi:hypothetical protein
MASDESLPVSHSRAAEPPRRPAASRADGLRGVLPQAAFPHDSLVRVFTISVAILYPEKSTTARWNQMTALSPIRASELESLRRWTTNVLNFRHLWYGPGGAAGVHAGPDTCHMEMLNSVRSNIDRPLRLVADVYCHHALKI